MITEIMTEIKDNHYCIEDPDLDAIEEIWVYPDYIQYNVEWG
jgi:hypothetical protein